MLAGCSLFNVIHACPVHLKLYYLLTCFFHWWNAAVKGCFWHLASSSLLWMMTSSWTCLSHLGLLTLSRMSASLFSNVKRFCSAVWTSSRTSLGPCNDDLSGASPQARIHELNESPCTWYSEPGVVLLQLHILHYSHSYVSFVAQAIFFASNSLLTRSVPLYVCSASTLILLVLDESNKTVDLEFSSHKFVRRPCITLYKYPAYVCLLGLFLYYLEVTCARVHH